MMCADFLHLKDVVDVFEDEGIDYLHIDIVDGHYAPNFTLGVGICEALYEYSRIPLDKHLMIDNPNNHIETFSSLTGSILSFHPETIPEPAETLKRIERAGLRPGIVVKPDLSLQQITPLLSHVVLLNIMTVHPGFAGQSLVPKAMEKIAEAAVLVESEGLPVEIEVDGNVSWKNAPLMHEAGARIFVTGTSSVFSSEGSLRENVERFRKILSPST
jgi:ribulose-phosphate 3-epimerase